MARIAIIAEKPSLAREALASMLRVRPELSGETYAMAFAFSVPHLDRSFELPLETSASDSTFRYPRGMRWSDLPAVSAPVYKRIRFHARRSEPWSFFPAVQGTFGRDWAPLFPESDLLWSDAQETELFERFGRAERIVAAMDASSSSVHAFDRAVMTIAPERAASDAVVYPWIADFTHVRLDEAMRGALPWRTIRDRELAHSVVKRRFTFNYALNAHPILGRALAETIRDTGMPIRDPAPVVASRNCLQLLYALRRRAEPMTEGRIVEMMDRWRGTGRYVFPDAYDVFGSPTSRASIVVNLQGTGLIVPVGEGRDRGHVVSAAGLDFLDRLHPDCEDPDQGLRLESWRRMPLDEAEPKVDRYIRTFFGKQKRFGDKVRRRDPDA